MVICARCFGLIIGMPLGVFIGLLGLVTSKWLLIPLFFPAIIDFESQRSGYRKSNNYLRLFTGIIMGFAVGSFVVIWICNDIKVFFSL